MRRNAAAMSRRLLLWPAILSLLSLGTVVLPSMNGTAQATGISVNRPGIVAFANEYWQRHGCDWWDADQLSHDCLGSGNPPSPYEPFDNDDCTDFISDAWHLGGGIPRNSSWTMHDKSFSYSGRAWTQSWTVVKQFIAYWVSTGQITEYNDDYALSHPGTYNHASFGDAVVIDQGNGAGYDHFYLEVGVANGYDLIDAHGNDRHNYRWNQFYLDANPVQRAKLHAITIHLNDATY